MNYPKTSSPGLRMKGESRLSCVYLWLSDSRPRFEPQVGEEINPLPTTTSSTCSGAFLAGLPRKIFALNPNHGCLQSMGYASQYKNKFVMRK